MKQDKCANAWCAKPNFVKQAYIIGYGFICLDCWNRDIDNPERKEQ